MSETLITIIAIFLAAVLMFVFPLMSVSERNDDIAQLSVQTLTQGFVDDVQKTGAITDHKYSSFVQSLGATGNTFDVDVELKILDENFSAKVGSSNVNKIGENVYYSVYTSQMEDTIESRR